MSERKKSSLGELRRRWKEILTAGGFSHVKSQGRLVALYVLLYADWGKCEITLTTQRVADRLMVRKSTAARGLRELVDAGILMPAGEKNGRSVYIVTKDFDSTKVQSREPRQAPKVSATKNRPAVGDGQTTVCPVPGDARVPYRGTTCPVPGDTPSPTAGRSVPYRGTNRPLQRNTLRPYRGHMTVSSTDVQSIISRKDSVGVQVVTGGTALSDGPPEDEKVS